MSKLINCKTCQREISRNAAVCPHCGERLKRASTASDMLAGLILLLIILGLLYYVIAK